MAADPGDIFELESPQATSIAMEESVLSEEEPLGPFQVLYSMIALHNATCLRVSFVRALMIVCLIQSSRS